MSALLTDGTLDRSLTFTFKYDLSTFCTGFEPIWDKDGMPFSLLETLQSFLRLDSVSFKLRIPWNALEVIIGVPSLRSLSFVDLSALPKFIPSSACSIGVVPLRNIQHTFDEIQSSHHGEDLVSIPPLAFSTLRSLVEINGQSERVSITVPYRSHALALLPQELL